MAFRGTQTVTTAGRGRGTQAFVQQQVPTPRQSIFGGGGFSVQPQEQQFQQVILQPGEVPQPMEIDTQNQQQV